MLSKRTKEEIASERRKEKICKKSQKGAKSKGRAREGGRILVSESGSGGTGPHHF